MTLKLREMLRDPYASAGLIQGAPGELFLPREVARGPSPESFGFIHAFAGAQLRIPTSRMRMPAQLRIAESSTTCPAWVPTNDVVFEATLLLGRALSDDEAAAVFAAHLVGIGGPGKDPLRPACVDNFKPEHIQKKARILRAAGFTFDELDRLITSGVVGNSHVDAAHYAITTDLYSGQIIDSHPYRMNNNNTLLYWVKLYNPATGRIREALFKPRIPGDNDGWGRQPMEYVAYALNRMLGMDFVPPVAYRRHLDVDGQHFHEGAMLYLVPDAHPLWRVHHDYWGDSREKFLSDARILDVLLMNPDRVGPNYLRGRHWVDGRYLPMLIDHAASLRPRTIMNLEMSDSFGSGQILMVRENTFEHLKRLNWDWLKRDVGEFLSDDEIRGILQRRDGIVWYFEDRASKYGRENVIVP